MGIFAVLLSITCIYYSCTAVARSAYAIWYCGSISIHAVFALGRTLQLISWPPGSSPYSGPPTWWDAAWHCLTLGPLRRMFGPGTFLRSYALLVVPAGGVAAVAGAALAARSEALRELAAEARARARTLLGCAVCLASAALADDAVRRCVLCGRAFPAALRGSVAAWLGFAGVVAAAGRPADGGLSEEQVLAWCRVLALLAAALTAGAGGGTLLLYGTAAAASTAAAGASAAKQAALGAYADAGAAAAGLAASSELTDRMAFLGYGALLSLFAAACACSLAGSDLMWRAAAAALRLMDALARPGLLLRGTRAAARWVAGVPAVRASVAAGKRLDDAFTDLLYESLRRTVAVARSAQRVVSHGLWPLVRDMGRSVYGGILSPAGRAGSWAVRTTARAVRTAAAATHRRVIVPTGSAILALARAARDTAVSTYTSIVRPLLVATWHLTCSLAVRTASLLAPPLSCCAALARRVVAPVLWPCGAVAGAAWFARQAGAQRSLLPFGGAAYASALIVCLMLGKAMRKTRRPALSRAGAALESAAASAYLHLDLGAGSLLARVLSVLLGVWIFVSAALMRAGRTVTALLAGPLLGALAAALTAAAWVTKAVARVVGPRVAATAAALRAGVTAVWGNPELSLAAAVAVVGLAYGAHVAGLPGAAARGAAWLAAATVTGLARLLLLLARPLVRPFLALAPRAARLLGLSAGASARAASDASAALAAWGARAAADTSSLFASRGFGGAFLGLNVAHALLLRGWAVPALTRQGAAGRAAVLPVVSFVARSTGKVALGPMYLTAAAAFLLGGDAGGGVASRLGSLTAPALWLSYLAAMYLEAVRRVSLSHDATRDSEFGRALRAVREASAQQAYPARTTAVSPPGPPPAATPSAGEVPATAPTSSNLPANLSAAESLDPTERRLLAELQAQAPPGHVFASDTCAVCMEDMHLMAPDTAGGGGQNTGSANSQAVPLDARNRDQAAATTQAGAAAEGQGSGGEGPTGAREAVQALRCGHAFHAGCILSWLKRSPRCPVCREPAIGPSRHANMLF